MPHSNAEAVLCDRRSSQTVPFLAFFMPGTRDFQKYDHIVGGGLQNNDVFREWNLVILIATKLKVNTKAQDINYFIPCNESYICSVISKLKW